MDIAVIGGGASGIFAALQAAWQGASVTLFERNETLGRKLLVTGSGRCNLSNRQVSARRYTCSAPAWLETLLNQFSVSTLLETLNTLGIPTYQTDDGWLYPLSNSSHAVVNILTEGIAQAGVRVKTAHPVTDLTRNGQRFTIHFQQEGRHNQTTFDRVIVASGGKAYPTLGSTGDFYPILQRLGHTIVPIKPALAPVLADLGPVGSLQGMRLDLGVTLYQDNACLAQTAGNMIFTQWGLNGPAVMDLSHFVSTSEGSNQEIALNLLHFVEGDFNQLLKHKRRTRTPILLLLSAFFPPKVAQCYTKLSGFSAKTSLDALDDSSIRHMITILKDTRIKVRGVRGYQYSQISTGGVPVDEVSPRTLASDIVPGLYLTGETLDVVGPCGGYNLHFAFASGSLAGRAASNPKTPI